MLAASHVILNGPHIGLCCYTVTHDTMGVVYLVHVGAADCAAGGLDDNADDGAQAGWTTFEVWAHVCHCVQLSPVVLMLSPTGSLDAMSFRFVWIHS